MEENETVTSPESTPEESAPEGGDILAQLAALRRELGEMRTAGSLRTSGGEKTYDPWDMGWK